MCYQKLTQKTALKEVASGLAESLYEFSKQPLSVLQISNTEHSLVKCYNQKRKAMNFDDLRYEEYHSKAFNFDAKQLPSTSESIYKYIKHAYYQSYMWVNAATNQSMFVDPLYYGYILDNGLLVAEISSSEHPDDFQLPCTCKKYAQDVCPCRIKSIGCCQYCKCTKSECKNPKTAENSNKETGKGT